MNMNEKPDEIQRNPCWFCLFGTFSLAFIVVSAVLAFVVKAYDQANYCGIIAIMFFLLAEKVR